MRSAHRRSIGTFKQGCTICCTVVAFWRVGDADGEPMSPVPVTNFSSWSLKVIDDEEQEAKIVGHKQQKEDQDDGVLSCERKAKGVNVAE